MTAEKAPITEAMRGVANEENPVRTAANLAAQAAGIQDVNLKPGPVEYHPQGMNPPSIVPHPPGHVAQEVRAEMVNPDGYQLEKMVLEALVNRAGYANVDTVLGMIAERYGKHIERKRVMKRLAILVDQELAEKSVKPKGYFKLTTRGWQVANNTLARQPVGALVGGFYNTAYAGVVGQQRAGDTTASAAGPQPAKTEE